MANRGTGRLLKARAVLATATTSGSRASWDVTHDDYKGWQFTVTIARGEIVGLGVESNGETVGKRTLTHLPLRDFEAAIREWASGDVHMSETLRHILFTARRKATPPRVATKWTDAELALFARDYCAAAVERAPIPLLAEKWHISPKRVRHVRKLAEEAGLISPAPRGRAGGVLTDKAKEILDGGQ